MVALLMVAPMVAPMVALMVTLLMVAPMVAPMVALLIGALVDGVVELGPAEHAFPDGLVHAVLADDENLNIWGVESTLAVCCYWQDDP
eukprot:2571975-Pyramimonas_sp.AAC.1